MAASLDGQTYSDIFRSLLSHGHEFHFVQVMRLSRAFLGQLNRVRVRPGLSLGFPAADIAGIETTGADDTDLLVNATFGGLYGVDSPLPTFITEELQDELSSDSSVCRDFLDIIHQQLYLLVSSCWSKYRLCIKVAEQGDPRDSERLLCLIGLGGADAAEGLPDSTSLLRYVNLFTQMPRSALGLQTLLRDALNTNSITICQCSRRMARIPADQRMLMGKTGSSLGMDTVMGNELSDRMGKFVVRIGPLRMKEFMALLPGTDRHARLVALVRFYIIDPLEFDLLLTLAAGEVHPLCLGAQDGPRLGWNTWSFAGDTLGEVSVVFALSFQPGHGSSVREIDSPDFPPPERPRQTLTDSYQSELMTLRNGLEEYSRIHPGLAAMVMSDTGVARLLEGSAFLFALVRMKLNDDIPEIIHEMTEILHPWDLRPMPATTIVAFNPKEELKQPLLIPMGAEVASVPVQGTRCRFRTCFDVTVHPLALQKAVFSQPSGKAPCITLQLKLNGMGLSAWKVKFLRFFLADDYPAACELYLLLMRYLKRIRITSRNNGVTIEIPACCLRPVGFDDDETILAKGTCHFPGHLILQEYFLMLDKFLFMDLTGLERCSTLGDGSEFEISFELSSCPVAEPRVTSKSFTLFAVPAINLFAQKAKPLSFITELHRNVIRPAGVPVEHFQTYSVDQVKGLVKNTSAKITYERQNPLLRHSMTGHFCHVTHGTSATGEGFDTFISIPRHEIEIQSSRIKLDIDLTCTNGNLPEQLNVGDICTATTTIPESVEPGNIKPVTSATFQGTQQNRQWRLLSNFSLNRTSLDGVTNLREILRLFVNPNSRNQFAVTANLKKIEAVVSIDAKPTDRLIGRSMFRGYDIRIKLRGDHFAGAGDLYLFSSVLERFFGGYVTQNCFIRLVVEEIVKGYRFEWPARIGDRFML